MATTNKKKDDALTNAYTTAAQVSEKAKSLTPNQEGIKQLSEYKNLVNQKTSALSSLGQANKQALKYADTTALAQGYATQGAALQNVGNIQNAYMNQVGGINQQYQQQLGALKDTASQNAFTNFEAEASNVVGTAKNEAEMAQGLASLLDAYGGQMNAEQLGQAQRYIDNISKQVSTPSYDNSNIHSNNTTVTDSNNNSTNVSYTANFSNGDGLNKNFIVSINGKSYELEMGNYASAYLTNTSKNKVLDAAKDKKVGEIWEYSNGKKTVLLVKTGDNTVRVVEKAGISPKDYEEVAKLLGYSRKKNIEKA